VRYDNRVKCVIIVTRRAAWSLVVLFIAAGAVFLARGGASTGAQSASAPAMAAILAAPSNIDNGVWMDYQVDSPSSV
jgi:hypothetical protein